MSTPNLNEYYREYLLAFSASLNGDVIPPPVSMSLESAAAIALGVQDGKDPNPDVRNKDDVYELVMGMIADPQPDVEIADHEE